MDKSDLTKAVTGIAASSTGDQEKLCELLTQYIIQAQEEERKRLALELHDGVGQALYSIVVGLNIIERLDVADDVQSHLRTVKEMTLQALNEVRNIAVELRPSSLDDWGLLPALRAYIKQFERTYGIEVEFFADGQERRYAPAVETALYRICQESMINAAKYANTDKISLYFNDTDEQIMLTIADCGKGFNLSKLQIHGTGFGLYGMKERARLIGGNLQLETMPGKGTTVKVTVPLVDERKKA